MIVAADAAEIMFFWWVSMIFSEHQWLPINENHQKSSQTHDFGRLRGRNHDFLTIFHREAIGFPLKIIKNLWFSVGNPWFPIENHQQICDSASKTDGFPSWIIAYGLCVIGSISSISYENPYEIMEIQRIGALKGPGETPRGPRGGGSLDFYDFIGFFLR